MKPVIRLKTVVLPAPFGPISPRISPCCNSNDRSETARKPPKSLRKLDTSSSAMTFTRARSRSSEPQPPPDAFRQIADDQHHEEPVEDEMADRKRSRKIFAMVTSTTAPTIGPAVVASPPTTAMNTISTDSEIANTASGSM